MQSLIRSKSAGVTGGRGTAGAGPGRDLLYSTAPHGQSTETETTRNRPGAQNQRGTTGNQRHQQGEKQKKKTGHHSTAPHGSTAPQDTAQGSRTPQGRRRATARPDTGTKADTHHQTPTPGNQSHQQTPDKRQRHQEPTTPATRNSTDEAHSTTKGHQHSAAQHRTGLRGQGTHSTTPQNTHSRHAAARNKQQPQAATQTNGRARQHTTTRQHSATEHNTGQRNTKTHHAEPHGGEPRGQTKTAPPKHDTKTHQETAEDSQAQQRTPRNTSQRTQSNDRDSTNEAQAGTPDGPRHTNPPRTAQPAKKKKQNGNRKMKKQRKKKGGGGAQRPQATGKQETPETTRGGAKKRRGGRQDAKAQGTRGRKTRKAGHNEGATRGGKGRRKKKNNNHKRGNPCPEWAEQAKGEPRTAKRKVRRTRTRPEGRTARPGQAGHAHAHTRGTRAWRLPTRKGRCWRSHKTAPVHRPSPPSQDGRYGKPDASVTGSTHAKPPQRTEPEGPARDNPIAGPRTGTTRSAPSALASAGASGRHNEPSSRPASTCPVQPPSKAGGDSPRGGGRHHSDGKADRSTESNRTGRGAADQHGATRHAREARCRPQPRHGDRCQATTATGCREPGKCAQHTTNRGTGQGAKDSRAPTPAHRTHGQWEAGPGRTPERTGGRGWESAGPRTPQTQARGAPPGHPHAAPTARKSARCGVGDRSPPPHPRTHSPWVVGPGRTPERTRGRGWESARPWTLHNQARGARPGNPHATPTARKSTRCGVGDGSPRPQRPHPQPVGSGPRPHARTDERSGVGECPSPDAPHTGRRPPPRAPSCRPHSTQERALWGW